MANQNTTISDTGPQFLNILNIHNVPDYAKSIPYWAVRLCNGEIWFYGAYPSDTALDAKRLTELNAFFIKNPSCDS